MSKRAGSAERGGGVSAAIDPGGQPLAELLPRRFDESLAEVGNEEGQWECSSERGRKRHGARERVNHGRAYRVRAPSGTAGSDATGRSRCQSSL